MKAEIEVTWPGKASNLEKARTRVPLWRPWGRGAGTHSGLGVIPASEEEEVAAKP